MTGLEFREARRALRLTQDQTAARLGVSAVTIRNWESGRHRIPHATAELVRTWKEVATP